MTINNCNELNTYKINEFKDIYKFNKKLDYYIGTINNDGTFSGNLINIDDISDLNKIDKFFLCKKTKQQIISDIIMERLEKEINNMNLVDDEIIYKKTITELNKLLGEINSNLNQLDYHDSDRFINYLSNNGFRGEGPENDKLRKEIINKWTLLKNNLKEIKKKIINNIEAKKKEDEEERIKKEKEKEKEAEEEQIKKEKEKKAGEERIKKEKIDIILKQYEKAKNFLINKRIYGKAKNLEEERFKYIINKKSHNLILESIGYKTY